MPKVFPIVYVRGYAGTQGEVEETVDDPFYGFSKGSTHIRINAREEPQFFAFESPLVRLMKDYRYRDAYYGNAQQVPPPDDDQLWPQSIWIYRYYDPTSNTFTWRGVRLTIEKAAADLRDFIKNVVLKSMPAGTKVWLVAHSMGGLVARCMIQKIAPDKGEQALDYVDKLFTYGTPHGGIHFGMAGGGAIEWIRDKIGWNNADDFGRQRMYEYLTPGKLAKKPPADFEPRALPETAFPRDRVFCVVGTNAKDYDVAMGLSRKTVGPQSDGLVQINSAYVIGAHRAYVHRSHSGRYGMVNSEETYQNLRRFLFGDVKVRAILENADLPSDDGVFFQADVRIAIRALPVAMHERTMAHLCPLLLSTPVIADEAVEHRIENQQQAAGRYHLFTTFLIPKEKDDHDQARRWAVSLAIYKLRTDARGNLRFEGNLEQVPYWADALIIDVIPQMDGYGANYVWASSEGQRTELQLEPIADGDQEGLGASIDFPEVAALKLGVRPRIRLETYAWT